MELMEFILGAGTSLLSGGLTGLIGTGLSMLGDHFKRKQDLEMRRLDNAHELNVMQHEWDGRHKVALTEAEAAKDVQDGKAFATSFGMEPKRYLDVPAKDMPWLVRVLLGFVDFWRGLIRPAMTTYLVVLVSIMFTTFLALMEEQGTVIDMNQITAIVIHIVYSIVYLATTCTLWWFGTRNKNQPPRIA